MLRKTTLAVLTIGMLALPAFAGAAPVKFNVDAVHSEIGFKVRHLASKSVGRFNEFTGEILVDPQDPSTMSFTGKIQVASIETHNEKRDAHLRSPEFFDVEKYPEMTFTSKKTAKKGDRYEISGDLSLRDVTKEVVLTVEVLGFTPTPWGTTNAGFEASGKINRKDFGVNWNKALDQGGFVLGDEVEIHILIEANQAKEDQAKK